MIKISRRRFVHVAGTSAVLGSLNPAALRAASPVHRPNVAFIGCGGRAQSLLKEFAGHAQIGWACDPDRDRAKLFQKAAEAKHVTTDLREVLDDASVEAVVVATPDHWHAPASILACNAGKHVYVEKPCSHNLREGRLLVEAARRNEVVVQHGTQSRNSPLIADAIQILREGGIGTVLGAKAWNVQRRLDIGRGMPSAAPASLDYDTWVGPAPWVPFQPNRFHYNWHWWYDFGTGDIGNDGAHELDMARWGLGVEGLPTVASAVGGKYYFDDDQEFPDTATCVFEWQGDGSFGRRRQLTFEMRIWSKTYPHNCDSGVEFYGTRGMLFVSKRGKLMMWDDSNRAIANPKPKTRAPVAATHQLDFLAAIAERRKPAADIAIGHDSTALIHLANASLRVGRSLQIDPVSEFVIGDDDANALLSRSYRQGGHWGVPADV